MYNKKWEASFSDVFWSVIRAWKKLLIIAVCFMVLFSVFVVYKKAKQDKQIASMLALSEEQLKQVNSICDDYNIYLANEETIKSDYLVTLDTSNLYCVTVRYYVDNIAWYDGADAKWNAAWKFYTDLTNNNAIKQAVADTKNNLTTWDLNSMLVYTADSKLVTVTIKAASEEDANVFAEAVKASIEDLRVQLCDEFIKHDLVVVDEYSFRGEDPNITSAANNKKNTLTSQYNTMRDNAKNFTYAQLVELENRIGTRFDIETEEDAGKGINLPLYIIAGCAMGFLLGVIYVILSYSYSKKVKSIDEVAQLTGRYTAGPIIVDSKSKLDMAINAKAFGISFKNSEQQLSCLYERIMNKLDVKDIAIIADNYVIKSDNLDKLIAIFKKNKINCQKIEQLLTKTESMKAVKNYSDVIIAVKLDKSVQQELLDQLNFCIECGINVLGVIVL